MSLLPDPQRCGDIKFLFAKGLSYDRRLKVVVAGLAAGLLIQLFFNFFLGIIVLGAATGLSLVQGYANRPVLTDGEEWSQVTPDEYDKIRKKEQQIRRWDSDMFDVTNRLGGSTFAIAAVCVGVIWLLLTGLGKDTLARYWVWDMTVVFIPQWITGVKTYLKQDRLITKINFLEHIISTLSQPSDVQVLPMLAARSAQGGGKVPVDCRLMIRFLNAPEAFLGMQVQISINSVQGNDYPYLYCVLIAKKGADFFKNTAPVKNSITGNIIIEHSSSADVDVLVIRQRTTQTSGYSTPLNTARSIVMSGLAAARGLLEQTVKA